mgnify:FL=1
MMNSCVPTDVDVDARGGQPPQRDVALGASDTEQQELKQVQALMKEQVLGLAPGPATEAAAYQIRTGGSLLRARLALASGHAFECSPRYRVAAAAACELIHNASLVHDDLTDRDEERRGRPTVWKRFGEDVALCTGDLLLCTAFGISAAIDDPQASGALVRQLTLMTGRTIVGQSREVAVTEGETRPGLRSYLETTTAKTVPLIELPLITGAVAAGAGANVMGDIGRFAQAVGLAYQIIDDLDDLVEGPRTLHPYHAWHHHRAAGQADAGARFSRATQHALAALNRAQRSLARLDRRIPGALAHRLQPLLSQLEARAMEHRRNGAPDGEPASHGQFPQH